MINEVLSLRHQMQEQLDIEYKERDLQKKAERRRKLRSMKVQGESLNNERGKKGGSAKPKSGEGKLKTSRRQLDDIEKKMSDLVSVFSGDLKIKEEPQLSGEGNKKTKNPFVIPPLEIQKSTER
jgi:hypothetical protein